MLSLHLFEKIAPRLASICCNQTVATIYWATYCSKKKKRRTASTTCTKFLLPIFFFSSLHTVKNNLRSNLVHTCA